MVLYFTTIQGSMYSFIDSFSCSPCLELGIQWRMNSGVRVYQLANWAGDRADGTGCRTIDVGWGEGGRPVPADI